MRGIIILPLRSRRSSAMITRIPMRLRLLPPTKRPPGMRAPFFGVGVDALVLVIITTTAAEGRVVGGVIVGVV